MYDSIQVTAGLLVLGQFGRSCRTDLEPKHSTDNRYPGERPEQMKVIDGIPVWGSPVDEGALKQIKNCARTADKVALMADHHKGHAVPIGGVVAYENSISPSGVGYDIACGNKAVCTDASASEVRRNIAILMDDVWRFLSCGVGRKNGEPVDHALFDDPAWSLPAVAPLKEMARKQLGDRGFWKSLCGHLRGGDTS